VRNSTIWCEERQLCVNNVDSVTNNDDSPYSCILTAALQHSPQESGSLGPRPLGPRVLGSQVPGPVFIVSRTLYSQTIHCRMYGPNTETQITHVRVVTQRERSTIKVLDLLVWSE